VLSLVAHYLALSLQPNWLVLSMVQVGWCHQVDWWQAGWCCHWWQVGWCHHWWQVGWYCKLTGVVTGGKLAGIVTGGKLAAVITGGKLAGGAGTKDDLVEGSYTLLQR